MYYPPEATRGKHWGLGMSPPPLYWCTSQITSRSSSTKVFVEDYNIIIVVYSSLIVYDTEYIIVYVMGNEIMVVVIRSIMNTGYL